MDKQGMKGILGKDNNRCKAKSMQKHSIRKTKLFSMVGVGQERALYTIGENSRFFLCLVGETAEMF